MRCPAPAHNPKYRFTVEEFLTACKRVADHAVVHEGGKEGEGHQTAEEGQGQKKGKGDEEGSGIMSGLSEPSKDDR